MHWPGRPRSAIRRQRTTEQTAFSHFFAQTCRSTHHLMVRCCGFEVHLIVFNKREPVYQKRMPRKNSHEYVLVGSTGADKSHWRWSIFSEGDDKKALQSGAFFGSLPAARAYVEAAVWRLDNGIDDEQ